MAYSLRVLILDTMAHSTTVGLLTKSLPIFVPPHILAENLNGGTGGLRGLLVVSSTALEVGVGSFTQTLSSFEWIDRQIHRCLGP